MKPGKRERIIWLYCMVESKEKRCLTRTTGSNVIPRVQNLSA